MKNYNAVTSKSGHSRLQEVVAIIYERYSNYRALNAKNLVLWMGGRTWRFDRSVGTWAKAVRSQCFSFSKMADLFIERR